MVSCRDTSAPSANRGILEFRTTWLLALAVAVGTTQPASGQTLGTVLTLDAATGRVMEHSAVIQGARAAAEESNALRREARSGYFPKLSFAESWHRSDDPVFVFGALLSSRQFTASSFAIDQLNHPDSRNLFRSSVSIGQALFDGGRTRAVVDAAGRRREIADAELDQARADLALSAARAYGRVLSAQATQLAAAAASSAAESDLGRARDRRDAGRATEADVLAVALHLAVVHQRAIQAAGDAAIARAELNRLMGTAVDEDYQVQEPPPTPPVTTDLPALLATADAANPQIARAAAAERLAATGSRAAHSAWWPDLSAQAGMDFSGTQFGARAASWIAGTELRWTISTGGAESARVGAALAAERQAHAAAEDARAAVHVEVVTALRQLESARARAEVARAALDQARERQRILRDRYDAGLSSITDVLQASSAVLDADTQRVAAVIDQFVGEAALQHALGRLVPSGSSR